MTRTQKLFATWILLSFVSPTAFAGNSDTTGVHLRKATFYVGWGYNRDWYSRGKIHMKNDHPQLINGKYYTYDYTVYNATAHDRPDFDQIYDLANVTIPQFNIRAGFYLNNKHDLGLEFNYDHAKYVVTDYQKVRVKGRVNDEYFDHEMILDPKTFLHYEHSDGANFFMFSLIKRWKFAATADNHNNIGFVVKPGVGFVYPRTDVTVFGHRVNNDWKISGIVGGVDAGVRGEFLKHGYLEFTGKGGYADYINTLVQGKGNGESSNTFWYFEAILVLGFQFGL